MWPLVWSQSLIEKVASSYHPSKCSFQSWIIKMSSLQPSVLGTNIFFALTQYCALNYTIEIILSDFFWKTVDGIVVLVREYRESTGDQFNLVSEAQGPFSIWMSDCFSLFILYPFINSVHQFDWFLSPSRFTEKTGFPAQNIILFPLRFWCLLLNFLVSRISTISTDC